MKTAIDAVKRALAAREAISQFHGSWETPEFQRLNTEDDLAHLALEIAPIRTTGDAIAMAEFGRIDEHDQACKVSLRRGLDWLSGQDYRASNSPSDILTEKEVRDILRVSRTTLWKLRQEDPAFPKPFNKSPRMLRFYRGDVERYVSASGIDK